MCEPYGGGRQPPVLPVAYRRMEWYNSEVFWAGVSAFCAPQSPLCRGRWHGVAVTKVIIPSRLPASQSHTKGFGLYACRAGAQNGEPPPLSCPCRSNVALLRLLARIAPVAPQGIVAVSATGGAPIPCPSEEGDCGERLQTPFISQFDQ